MFAIHYLSGLSDELRSEITQLSAKVSYIYSLSGKHAILLSSQGKLDVSLSEIQNTLSELSKASWLFIPSGPVDSVAEIENYAEHLDVEKSLKFIELYKDGYPKINSLAGSIRGALLSSVVGLKWGTFRATWQILMKTGRK